MIINQRYKNLHTSETLLQMTNDVDMLKQNVFDLQTQLQAAYIRINELTQIIQDRHDSHSRY